MDTARTDTAQPLQDTAMKGVVQHVYGPVDSLRLEAVARPDTGAGEVLLRVRAAGVDRGMWHLMTGRPYLIRLVGFGLRPPQGGRVLGREVAGEVVAVGPGVTRFRRGDEVFGTCDGSFAEYAKAREDHLARKPAGLTFPQAAAIPVSAVTALQALRDQGRVAAGQRVLIVGASGGVGSFAVQLAKAFGAEVAGVCSTQKVDLVRSLGADRVIDYTREDITDGGRPYDLIVDMGGNRPLSLLRSLLASRGTLVIVGGEGGGQWTGMGREFRALALSPIVRQRLRVFFTKENGQDLETLCDLVDAGKVTPLVDRTYPLAEALEAIRYLEAGRVRGKVVLTLG